MVDGRVQRRLLFLHGQLLQVDRATGRRGRSCRVYGSVVGPFVG